jgi:hypothetical protein
MRLLVLLGLLLAALSWLALPHVTAARQALPYDVVVVPAGQRWKGDLATVVDAVVVEGEVSGDVTSWSGDIRVSGRVGGDVVSYGGLVELGPRARVEGSVLALAGVMRREGVAQVEGESFAPPLGTTAASLAGFTGVVENRPSSALRALLTSGGALALIALSLLVPALWPVRSGAVARMLRRRPGYSLGLGLLSGLLVALLVAPLALLLALTLIGLPLLPLLLLLTLLVFGLGLAAVARALGTQLGMVRPVRAGLLGALLLVGPLLLVGQFAPLLALGLFYLIGSLGLGALVISRGGTILLPEKG